MGHTLGGELGHYHWGLSAGCAMTEEVVCLSQHAGSQSNEACYPCTFFCTVLSVGTTFRGGHGSNAHSESASPMWRAAGMRQVHCDLISGLQGTTLSM